MSMEIRVAHVTYFYLACYAFFRLDDVTMYCFPIVFKLLFFVRLAPFLDILSSSYDDSSCTTDYDTTMEDEFF